MLINNNGYIVYPGVCVEQDVSIGEFSIIGRPSRPSKHDGQDNKGGGDHEGRTKLGAGTDVGSFVLIEEGAHIGQNCVIETGAVVEAHATVGEHCFIVHGARLGAECSVGKSSVIGGFVAERSIVGEHSRVFGMLVHRQLDPTLPWDAVSEPAPVLDSNVFVGMGAVVVGPVKIGTHVYIAAGAIVTKDVPSFSIVHGMNRMHEPGKWNGHLHNSPFWGRGKS